MSSNSSLGMNEDSLLIKTLCFDFEVKSNLGTLTEKPHGSRNGSVPCMSVQPTTLLCALLQLRYLLVPWDCTVFCLCCTNCVLWQKRLQKKKSWAQFVTANAGEAMIARIWAEMGAEKFLVLLIAFGWEIDEQIRCRGRGSTSCG